MTVHQVNCCIPAPPCGNILYDLEHKCHFLKCIFMFLKKTCFLLFLPIIWKHNAKRNYFKGILNLSQRENVLRLQGVTLLIFYPFDQRKFADHFYLSPSQSLMSPFITTDTLFTLKHQFGCLFFFYMLELMQFGVFFLLKVHI